MVTFVTVAMVIYDGEGNFTSTGTSSGSVSGVRTSSASRTYHVNADCTGTETMTIPIPNVPPIEDNFVIVTSQPRRSARQLSQKHAPVRARMWNRLPPILRAFWGREGGCNSEREIYC